MGGFQIKNQLVLLLQGENTATQNEQCLKNFDLSEYRIVFSDLAVWIYMVSTRDGSLFDCISQLQTILYYNVMTQGNSQEYPEVLRAYSGCNNKDFVH